MYLVVFIVACVFDIILEKIKDFKLYYYGLKIVPYTRYDLISSLEKVLFEITKISQSIPYLIYKPHLFKVADLSHDQSSAISVPEKIFIFIERVFTTLNLVFGIRIAYLVMICIWFWKEFNIQIIDVYEKISNIDYLSYIQKGYEYLSTNGSAILLVIIALLSSYIYWMKKKNRAYQFEKIWISEEKEKIKEIADTQIEILNLLLKVRPIIYKNCEACSSCVRQIDCIIKFKSEDYSLQYDFQEYRSIVEDIKDKIKFIEDNNGRRLFVKYNKRIWFQLFLFGLTDSKKEYLWHGIGSCDKTYLEQDVSDLNENNIKLTRESMFSCWTSCISVLNGIQRYLIYISKRKSKHIKLLANLENFEDIKKAVSNFKE